MALIRRYPLVLTTLLVMILGGSLWLAGMASHAVWVTGVYVGGIILWVSIDMIKDILRGHWGLDILAVVAMVATLASGEYAAAIVVALMITGGQALEDYA